MSLTDMVQVQGTNPNGETCMSPCGLMFYHHRGSGLQLYTDQLCQLVGVSWLWSTAFSRASIAQVGVSKAEENSG